MDEKRLIETLRQGRGTPPPAPADEWFRVAKATVGATSPRPLRAWAWGLGLGMGLAALWLALPLLQPRPSAVAPAAPAQEAASVPSDELNQALETLSSGYAVPDSDIAEAPGEDMLALLDEV
jgi:hypothetical protein